MTELESRIVTDTIFANCILSEANRIATSVVGSILFVVVVVLVVLNVTPLVVLIGSSVVGRSVRGMSLVVVGGSPDGTAISYVCFWVKKC